MIQPGQTPPAARSAIAERFSRNFFLACTALAFMTFVLILIFIWKGETVPVAIAYGLIFFIVIMTFSVIGAAIIEKRLPK